MAEDLGYNSFESSYLRFQNFSRSFLICKLQAKFTFVLYFSRLLPKKAQHLVVSRPSLQIPPWLARRPDSHSSLACTHLNVRTWFPRRRSPATHWEISPAMLDSTIARRSAAHADPHPLHPARSDIAWRDRRRCVHLRPL